MKILYCCELCGLEDAGVEMRDRNPHEDLKSWMGELNLAVGANHHARSPYCQATEISQLKIPISGADYVGGPCTN